MKNLKLIAIIFSICAIMLTVSVCPISAIDYNPGVSVGQYVKFGNIVSTLNGEDVNNADWMKLEVISVSGKEVTIRTSGQLKNGSYLPNSGQTVIYNVENGTMMTGNFTVSYTYGPIIAANLNEGDLIPPVSYGFIVNKTETRTYLNVTRSVNILNTTYSDENYASNWTIFYDKASGMMLEFRFDWTQKAVPTTTTSSFSVVETNIFTAPVEQPFYSQWWFIIGLIVIVVVVVAIVALAMRRR